MKCPKCKSENVNIVMDTSGRVKGPSLMQKAGHMVKNTATLGVYGAIAGKPMGKTKSKPVALCQKCGNKFNP